MCSRPKLFHRASRSRNPLTLGRGGGGVETSCLSRNEGDLFEEMWNNGLSEGSPMNSIKISWDTVPYRDEEFKRRTIDAIGLDQWNKEYEFWV